MKQNTKICYACKKTKTVDEFGIDRRKVKNKEYIYLKGMCKECRKEYQSINYKKTKKVRIKSRKEYIKSNPWLKHYFNICTRCNGNTLTKWYKYYKAKGIKKILTIEDIKYLWFRDKAYNLELPLIHRKNHNKHYTKQNCVFIEKRDHPKKRITQLNLNGKRIMEFGSVSEAAKKVNTVVPNISLVLTGVTKTAKGFRWKYA